MSLVPSSRLFLALAVLGAGALLLPGARAEDKPRAKSPEFSERTSAEVTTNLLQLGNRQDGLRQLEEELNQSFKTFSPKSSLDGAFAPPQQVLPPPRPTLQNKRLQELIERQKNWMFMTPEDLAASPTPEDIFNLPQYGPDGQEKKKLSPLERYYQSLGRKPENPLKPKGSEDDPFNLRRDLGKNDEAGQSEEALPGTVKESEKALKKLLGKDNGPASAVPQPHSLLSDIFGLGQHILTPEEIKAHEDSVKRFQDILNGPPPPSANPLNALGNASDPVAAALHSSGGLPESSTGVPDGYDPRLGKVNPTYVPSGSVDLNAKLLNAWNPDYAPPRQEPPKLAPPTTSFTAPKRAFQ